MSNLLIDAATAAKVLDISVSHFHNLRRAGKLGPAPIRLGTSVKYSSEELAAWVSAGCPSQEQWRARGTASNSPALAL